MSKFFTTAIILSFYFLSAAYGQSSSSPASSQSVTCSSYLDAGPVNRMTGSGEENLLNGLYSGLAQRYNNVSGSISSVRFWARVPLSVGTAQTVRVIIYQENVGFPGTILGQTTVSVPSSATLNQVDAILSAPVSVSANIIIAIEPNVPSTDNVWVKHNEEGNASNSYIGDGGNLYLNLVKQGVTWYKNLANGDPSWDYDFMILPVKSVNIAAAFTYAPSNLTVAFTNASTNGTTYEWNFGDGNTSAQVSPSHTYGASGTYAVKLKSFGTDASCYDSLTQNVTVTMTGINELNLKNGIIVHYSPDNDLLTVEANSDMTVSLYNILGVRIQTFALTKNVKKEIEMSEMSNGIYLINSPGFTSRFIKN